MMQRLVLWAIEVYQRHLSPRKGFSCAYRCHTGHASCSQLGWRAVRRWGAVGGLQVLRQRLFMCGVAYRRYGPLQPARRGVYRGPRAAQQGECDIGCDAPCDSPGGKDCGGGGGRSGCGFGDALRCADCFSCDLWERRKDRPSSRRKGKGWGDEKYVYIPPASGRRKDEKR
ncbi:membrane protein insertion efficiency factor YidD [Ideonella sp.]|jgi:putative component of membrane protein insertase Oxa1/YidC/SpoIIIJ protein YidD|uniref:membrane protein insertion efficiency factor YidD n=1 Tax=Ideonella sp. TaxID=1929293 RepID=UPI0037BF4BDA